MEPIFHVAFAVDWARAAASGVYDTSTRGQSLGEVGFIHCSFDSQVAGIGSFIYGDATDPLVLLTIDPSLVAHEIKVENGYPHIYGPLNTNAVVNVEPFDV